ncbi:hypothetical protein [Alienimonas californiensis]|uniref:Uncharacterized protein n=1 Tax=Alienimonas californiensis TaxID=2527989 RepID=A0A517PAA1_9PLAN|nr:hypothetical protein [Alienimonas californiensis]QDT16303.1 hypothetical protein CA12_24040 [Alienimonas californiensis]
MSAEPPLPDVAASSRALAEREPFPVSRAAGPWVWALAVLGLFLAVLPFYRYDAPAWDVLRVWWPYDPDGPRHPMDLPFHLRRDHPHPDPQRELEPTRLGVRVAAPPGGGAAIARHWRALEVRWNGPPFANVNDASHYDDQRTGDPYSMEGAPQEVKDWSLWESEPAWGVSVRRTFWGPGATLLPTEGRLAWKQLDLTVGIVWLLGPPLVWSLVRSVSFLRSARPPAEPSRWRLAARPWVGTFAAIGGGMLLLNGTWDTSGREHGPTIRDTRVTLVARRDRFSAIHPLFLRLTLDLPREARQTGVDVPSWVVGSRRWGFQADRRDSGRTLPGYAVFDHDDPRGGRPRVAFNLSLWYVLLPAALWSGVSLWRTRAGRMRPA